MLATAVRRAFPEASLRFALDGRAVLQLAAVSPPRAVLLSHRLPRADLGALCKRLRVQFPTARICVTGRSATDDPQLPDPGIGFVRIDPQEAREHLVRHLKLTLDVPMNTASSPAPITAPAPPPAPAPTSSPAPAEIIGGRYLLEERLGEGGMGSVFAARHVELDKRFALKILAPELMADSAARASFHSEAKLASRLSHPNIVSVIDFGRDPRRGMFMVMELLAGSVLSVAAPRLSVRRSCELLGQIADALEVLHRHDVVHGDVKTDNVMVIEEPDGSRRRTIARLIDFGLAHRISRPRAEGKLAGTPEYLAPERVRGLPATVAADVYALGIVAYELFTGQLPFTGTATEVLAAQCDRVAPPLRSREGAPLDPALDALVARAMSKDPALRHPTAAAFRYELNAVMNMLGFTRNVRVLEEAKLAATFHRSLLPQAIVSPDGHVQHANEAWKVLVGAFDALEPNVADALARAWDDRRSTLGLNPATGMSFVFAPTERGVHVVATLVI